MSNAQEISTETEDDTYYFIEYFPARKATRYRWTVTSREARSDLAAPPIIANPGENLVESFKSGQRYPFDHNRDDRGVFCELLIAPDRYHPRIARQIMGGSNVWAYPADGDREFIARGCDHLSAIIEQLSSIFRVVEPGGPNAEAYGPGILNLLIVSCTEVEAQWKSVLQANGCAGNNTKDYFKTCDALRLKEYSVLLAPYPWLASVQPFAEWSSDLPTQSLAWYHAYNGVKHDRYSNYSQATLSHCISAVTAIAVLLIAQFGATALTSEHRRMFAFQPLPERQPGNMYHSITGEWRPSNFVFGSS